jgi:O-antigen ligase
MITAITEMPLLKSQKPTADHRSPLFTAARVTLVATLMAAPLAFGAVEPWAWASLCVLSGVALALWAMGCAATGRIRLVLSPMHVVILLALMLVAGQLVLGKTVDPIGTRESLIKLIGYSTIFFLAGQLSTDLSPRAWRWFGFAIITYVFAMAVFAILQFFSNAELIYWTVKPRWGGAIFGSYVNHNHYAGLFEVLLPFAIGSLLALPERHALKLLGAFAVLLGLASVLLCGSRGGTIAVIVELAIFFAIMVSRASSESGRTTILAALAMAALASVFFAWLDPGSVLKRWKSTARAPEVAAGMRIDMTSDSMRMLGQNLVSGVGAGAYEVAYPTYQSFVTDSVVDHAHNDYAELLAETGAAGGLFLLTSLCMFFCQAFRKLRQRLTNAVGWMQTAAAIACCGLLIHSFTDFNLHIPANAAWFSAAAGLVAVVAVSTRVATPHVQDTASYNRI